MAEHERRFHHHHAQKLDDPERAKWLPVETVLERLALRPGMAVADVGTGTGYFALPFARAVSPGGRVLAVDVQPEMLEHLRARLEPGLPVTPVLGEATRTTLETGSVDLAFYANVWHEIDDRPAALVEAARLLRPDGRLAILDWRTDVATENGPRLAHRIASADVEAELLAAGWSVEPSGPLGPFHYLVLARAVRSPA